ncbi:PcfJ domain-containing protein [Bernardetia sp. MNP-M8]|uniref:PcfJ domain-containing protein n=1 Tax=Bernardetia sp. MNP-M8 TaxID=3127470 RepID=UPI0030D42CE3
MGATRNKKPSIRFELLSFTKTAVFVPPSYCLFVSKNSLKKMSIMALSKLKLKKIREEQILQNYQNTLKKNKNTHVKSLRKVAKQHAKNSVLPVYTNERVNKLVTLMSSGSHRKEFSEIINLIAQKGKTEALLQEDYILDALSCVAKEHSFFIRTIEDWKPKGRNSEKLFADLVRHLFVKYDIPACMTSLWFDSENKLSRSWFIDVGQGKNTSKLNHFPTILTKKEAHYFTKAPSKFTFIAAIRYGQVKAIGGTTGFINNLVQTDLGKYLYPKEGFWKEVIAFLFRNNPTATAHQLDIVVEYIWTQKFARLWGQNTKGQVVQKNPSDPNFDLKGRTWDSLWKKAFEWFKVVGFSRQTPQEWAHFMMEDNYVRAKTGQCFVFQQLLTKQELFEEGKNMNHCVGSYVSDCKNSKSAIFSMQNVLSRNNSLVTIEVDPKTRKIVQTSRRFNHFPSDFEKEIIKEWAKQNDLKVPSYY